MGRISSPSTRSVGNLADQIGLSQSALPQHLAKLREENLVEWRREAQAVYYSTRLQGWLNCSKRSEICLSSRLKRG